MAGEINKNKTIVIAGAGTMGAGIAMVCAGAGYKVKLYDLKEEVLKNAEISLHSSAKKLLEKGKVSEDYAKGVRSIQYTSIMGDLHGDFFIEAILEDAKLKIDLFHSLMKLNGEHAIYASNTSSIPITKIAAALPYPELVCGVHFFNPAQLMKLVEVVKGAKTSGDVIQQATDFVVSIGKVAVLAADSPGFIVNRIARLYYVESLKILEEGVCDLETIDRIMESTGFKMGPFRLMDLIGVDTNYSVTESQFALFNHEARFKPSRIQKQKVDAGLHGRKSGEGFYKYE